jgi:hypothetical protein
MRDGLRRVIAASPLRTSTAEWPPWTPEVLVYIALFGQGLAVPAPDRTDSASCSRVAAVLLHKDALAAAAAAEGVCAVASRACTPKSGGAFAPAALPVK